MLISLKRDKLIKGELSLEILEGTQGKPLVGRVRFDWDLEELQVCLSLWREPGPGAGGLLPGLPGL